MSTVRAGLVAAVTAVVLLLSACVSVPSSGRVERVEGQQQDCQNCVGVEVSPPSAGDDPLQIVEGFLRANAYYQPNYSVARQYLTPTAAQRWSPEDGVAVYTGSPSVTGDRVTMSYRLVGSVLSNRAYQVEDRDVTVDFGLVRAADGEWRIDAPPAGLMVAKYTFTQFYSSYDLYFVGNDGVMVPDPIYLPKLRNPANLASALVKALLNGPVRWLAPPAVSTAIPPGTTLSVDSVTISGGVATVPLSDAVLPLPDTQRSLLAAQTVYTLKEALGIRGVLFTVNQQPFRIPEGDPTTSVVNADAISADHNPVSGVAGDQLYVVRDGATQLVNPSSNDLTRLEGDLGSGKVAAGSLAVSVTDTDLAAVVDGGTRVVRTTTAGSGDLTTVLSGVTDVLRPQYTRFGELWVLGRQNGQQKLWRVGADGKPVEVSAPALRGRDVVAFRISPDGTRVGFVQRTPTGQQLGVALISRADAVTVDRWRTINTTQSTVPQLTRLRDVAWLDPTTLVVIGSATAKDVPSVYAVQQDGSGIIDEGEVLDWDPVSLAVRLRTQSATVLSSDDQSWRDEGSTWRPVVDQVTAIAYPG